jgi:Uma2 family endonuclease
MSEALKHASFEDLYRQLRTLPDTVQGEIIAGELVVSPRPAVPHADIALDLGAEVRIRFGRRPGGPDRPGGWWILPEPELHLQVPGETAVVSPDLAGWKHETLPALPRAAYLVTPPDWVCEILSPATARYDRRAKARIYHQAGVTWRWLVDPELQTIEVYRRQGEFWTLLGTWSNEEAAHLEPFDAVALNLAEWWAGITPPAE